MISTRRGVLLAAVAVLVACGIAAWLLLIREPERPPTATQRTFTGIRADDLAGARVFEPRRIGTRELLRRGRDGLAHPLYAETRGGVERTAAIMDRLSPYFERFGKAEKVDPLTLAAVVMVESGGRADLTEQPDSSAGRAGLAGLTPGAARDAGLRVELKASEGLTRRIDRLVTRQSKIERKSEAAELDPALIAMRARRRKLDERFDVRRAIEAAASLLGDRPGDPAVAAYRGGDDDFPFMVEAARQILVLYRDDPARLYELATLHGTKPGAEDVLRPPGDPDSYGSHEEIKAAFESGQLVPLPDDAERAGFRLGQDQDSRRVFSSELHRGLRPGALATLMYVAGSARRDAGESLTLQLGSAVRPETTKQRLEAAARSVGDGVAGPGAALSSKYLRPPASTGYSFELLRTLPGRDQEAVDAVLARLRALNVVEVVRDGNVDRVTVGRRAAELLDVVREARRYSR